jgi:hypothetical protein
MHILHDDDCFSDYQECQHQERGTASLIDLLTVVGIFPVIRRKKRKRNKNIRRSQEEEKRYDSSAKKKIAIIIRITMVNVLD